jgi:hypothetical protein
MHIKNMLSIITETTKHKKTRKPGSAEDHSPTCIRTQLWMQAIRILQTKAERVLDINSDNKITTFQHYMSTYILYSLIL